MTKIQLRRVIIIVICIYCLSILLGLFLRIIGPPTPTPYYKTFKDLIPFILAIPAAYLGYCFQQRGSYLQSLRGLWSQLVHAVNNAIQYTYSDVTSRDEYSKVLIDLSIIIDELRCMYRNIGEHSGHVGLYPYEPIKEIHKVISHLGYGELEEEKRLAARRVLTGHWKSMRENFLDEFDRPETTKVVSPYIKR
jgi:hypothetical protein